MSHHDENAESTANPIKIAIWVTIGAIAMIMGVYLLAKFAVGSRTLGASNEAAKSAEAVNARVAPLVTLTVDPTKGPVPAIESAKAAPAATTLAAAIVPAAIPVAGAAPSKAAGGEGIYKSSCSSCHAAGIAGAPKSGDKAAWAPRIAQGKDKLYEHAIKGFQGKGGVMPAKGGFANLSDGDVKSAVDYMVALNK